MGKLFGKMKWKKASRCLAGVLALFMLTGAVSGPACTAYAAEEDSAPAQDEADFVFEEETADSAFAGDGDGSDPETEAGTEDLASGDEQGVFTITYSANGGGYFADWSASDEKYAVFAEAVTAGTRICGRDSNDTSNDFSNDPFEAPSCSLSETEDTAEAVFRAGTAALYANDGNVFLGWSLQEDGTEMIPEEGIEISRDETVFAVWMQENPGEEAWPDEDPETVPETEAGRETEPGTGTEPGTVPETEAGTGTEPGTGTESEDELEIPTETENGADLFPETDPDTETQIETDPDTDVEMEAEAEPGEPAEVEPGESMEAEPGEPAEGKAGNPAEAEPGESAEVEPGQPSETESGEPAGGKIKEPEEDGIEAAADEEASEETGNSAIPDDEQDDRPEECTVTFDAQGGSFFNGESVLTETVRKGDTIRLSSYDEPEKEGCRFRGWTLEKDSDQPERERRFRVTENVTLYAVWAEYKTITFKANGGFYGRKRLPEKQVSFEAGERIDLDDYEPSPVGWEDFKGWSLSEEGTDILSGPYTVTDTVTLYAVWTRNIRDAEVKLSTCSYTYNGKARTPAVTVCYENRILKQGTDYTVSYSSNTNAGRATVTITGTGSYEGSISRKFTINKAPQKLTLTAAASRVSVGKTVKMKAAGAKETKKYSYKSSDRRIASVSSSGVVTAKKVGKVRITVSTEETPNYKKGSCFVIIRVVPGATKKLTAVNRKKGIRITWNKVPGASGYLLYRNGTKIATIKKGTTVSYMDKKANVKGKKYVYKLVAKASTGESTLARTVSIVRSLTSQKPASSSGDPQPSGTPSSGTSSSDSGSSGSGSSGSDTPGSSTQTGSSTELPLMNTRYCLEKDKVRTALQNCGENDFIVIDFDGISQSVITDALNRGVKIYGYINAGALEKDRAYYSRFSSLRLAEYDGWEGEYWVDVTSQSWKDHLIEEAQKLKAAGASGVYFDNTDILYMAESGFREEKTVMLRTAPSAGKVYTALRDAVMTIENTVGLTVMPNGGDIFVRRFVSEYPGVIREVNQEGVLYDNNRQQPASERNYLTEYLDWCKNRGIYIRGIEYINTTAGANAARTYYAEHGWDALYISRQKNLLGN